MSREAGPLVALGGLVAGIAYGEHAGPSAANVVLVLGAMSLLGAWAVSGRARVLTATCALALVGCALMQRSLDGLVHHRLAVAVERGDDRILRGELVSDPDGGRFRTEAYVRDDDAHRILLVRAAPADVARLRVLESGDRVELEGRLTPLPADRFGDQARWRHAVAVLDDARLAAFSSPTGVLASGANRMRTVLARGARPLPATSRAMLAGFLLGDTRGVPDETVRAYRDSGLSHLLAVSGANVAFVLACVAPMLRRLPLGARSAAAGGVVLVFATMTRFEPSVLRASAVTGVTVFATLVGRPSTRVRVLALAVIGVLLADPFLVHSVGFQLSVAATAGIAFAARPIAARLRGPRVLREALAVSLAAQVGVTPVLLATFGNVPIATPVTNLLAVPAAEILGVFGFLASLLGGLVPPLAPVLQPVDALLIGWISAVARAGARLGVDLDLRTTLVFAVAAAVVTLARRARRAAPAPA